MDITTFIPAATIVAALVGAFIAVRRLPGQELSESVGAHHTILGDMKLLNDTLIVECARLRAREATLVVELETSTIRGVALEQELAACCQRREALEAEAARRGLDLS